MLITTFYGMGVIAVITDKNDTCQEERLRNRPKKYVKVCMYLFMYSLSEVLLEGSNFRESAKFRELFLFFANSSMRKKKFKNKITSLQSYFSSGSLFILRYKKEFEVT